MQIYFNTVSVDSVELQGWCGVRHGSCLARVDMAKGRGKDQQKRHKMFEAVSGAEGRPELQEASHEAEESCR